MFETTGVINEEILKEIKNHMLPPKQKGILTGFIIVLSCLAVISILSQIYTLLIICLVGIVIFIIERIWLQNKHVKINLERFKENTGNTEASYSTTFNDDGVFVENLMTHARGTLKYEIFVKFVDTKNVYTLFTKSWQFVLVFKNCFDEKQSDEFIEFLKSKPTKIKW